MLTQIYIEALLVDEELADQVWEAWDKGRSAISGLLGLGGPLLFQCKIATSRGAAARSKYLVRYR